MLGTELDADTVAAIRTACTQPKTNGDGLLTLDLNHKCIGAAGGAVLGAALAAMPSPLPYEAMTLQDNELMDAGIAPIAAAIDGGRAPHLKSLDVRGNELGDEGMSALQAALAPHWLAGSDVVDQPAWSTHEFWEACAEEHREHAFEF